MTGLAQAVAAGEVPLIQDHTGARDKTRRLAVHDGERQRGTNAIAILVGKSNGKRQVEGFAPLVIQLAAQGNLGGDAPVAVVVAKTQFGAQHYLSTGGSDQLASCRVHGESDGVTVAG